MKLQGPIPIFFSNLINLEHLMLGDLEESILLLIS
uniref:Uncharacterized protein n=1 Tax=Setaria viridis TaxID=4556 RepID=A0A4V6Y930_SETVI|nr:hypothetical protein SEVIR_1G270000v2 [Setaria viridis]